MTTNLALALAGKFGPDVLIRAASELIEMRGDEPCKGWGLAYCYGNRLETATGGGPTAGTTGFDQLSDIRTDMALMSIGYGGDWSRQPVVRKGREATWALCHEAELRHPERLVSDTRRSGGADTGGLFLDYLVSRFKPDDPTGSMTEALTGLADEPDLSCVLINSDQMVFSRWQAAGDSNADAGLWLGRGPLLRVMAPQRLASLARVKWEPLENRSVVTVSRFRRPIG